MARELFAQILLYARTARHLRWQQILFRPLRHLQGRRFSNAPPEPLDLDALGRFGDRIAVWGADDLPARVARADGVCRGQFSFLGVTRQFPTVDWTSRHVSHLWTYNLHYFEYARDLAWAARATGKNQYVERLVGLIRDWISATEKAEGDGWEPYPLSTRIVNWCVAMALLRDRLAAADRTAIADSMHRQMHWLARRLELHLQGNHLQRNLTALCTVGPMFRRGTDRRVTEAARQRLWRELDDQIFPDGGHAERSPMYLALALSDFLYASAALQIGGVAIPPNAAARIAAMGFALAQLSRSDGTLHRFHDTADAIADDPNWLCATTAREFGADASRVEGPWSMPDGGYFGHRGEGGRSAFVVDAGQPGPPHLPAHAHCSLLSFELDMLGSPLIVDSGVNGYGDDQLRPYFRSTRAHNTVTVNDAEQSEIWGVFRIARRARLLSATLHGNVDSYVFEGAYQPFHDLSLVHSRRVEGTADGVTVSDRITGAPGAHVMTYLHLHPSWVVVATPSGFLARREGEAGSIEVSVQTVGIQSARVVMGERSPAQGWYAERFGAAMPGPTVEMAVLTPERFGYAIQRTRAAR
jgi:uncharacterized heparinase superfamily protein